MPLSQKLDAAGNAAAVVTLTTPRYLYWVAWSYSAAPTGGKLTIAIGATTKLEVDIIAGGPGFIRFEPPLTNEGAGTSNVVITLAAGGGTVVGKVTALYA